MSAALPSWRRPIPAASPSRIGYEEALAHRFYAAGDILLHPSRFEPCGLTPQYAMRYGTIPVVTSVGGLTDTVRDADAQAMRERHGDRLQLPGPERAGHARLPRPRA